MILYCFNLFARPLLVCLLLLASCQTIHAATYYVASYADSGPSTLRYYLGIADAGDIIRMNTADRIIKLTSDHLLVDTPNLKILGPETGKVTIHAAPGKNIFFVTEDLTIENLTLTGADTSNRGGAILVETADLTLKNCDLTANSSTHNSGGGAIYCISGLDEPYNFLTLENCFLSSNQAKQGGAIACDQYINISITNSNFSSNNASELNGGAICFKSRGNLNISNSFFSQNSAGISGGAVCDQNGYITSYVEITNTSFSNNHADGDNFGNGGGALSLASTGYITNCLFSENTAIYSGGALNLYSFGTDLRILNTTFYGNRANGYGGAIQFASSAGSSPTYHLSYCTITGNHSNNSDSGSCSGGGISKTGSSTSVSVKSCVIASNFKGSANITPDDLYITLLAGSPDYTSMGYNFIGSSDGGDGFSNGVNNDLVGTESIAIDPKLQALADNGGPTMTMAPEASSPLLDAGGPAENDEGYEVIIDQRGEPRLQGQASDIGAYEAEPGALVPIIVPVIQLLVDGE